MADKPTLFLKAFVGYIYFMQGVYGSLLGVIVYLFPVFPKPDVLSSFSLAALPFSFKFLTGNFSLTQPQSYKNSPFVVTEGVSFGFC